MHILNCDIFYDNIIMIIIIFVTGMMEYNYFGYPFVSILLLTLKKYSAIIINLIIFGLRGELIKWFKLEYAYLSWINIFFVIILSNDVIYYFSSKRVYSCPSRVKY